MTAQQEFLEFLARHKLSQAGFARMYGVTPRAVAMWVAGSRETPTPLNSFIRVFEKLDDRHRYQEIIGAYRPPLSRGRGETT